MIKWVPYHNGMARPLVTDGDGLKMWRVAANTMDKQSRTDNKGWSFILEDGQGANDCSS
jgi:hypothetical protein